MGGDAQETAARKGLIPKDEVRSHADGILSVGFDCNDEVLLMAVRREKPNFSSLKIVTGQTQGACHIHHGAQWIVVGHHPDECSVSTSLVVARGVLRDNFAREVEYRFCGQALLGSNTERVDIVRSIVEGESTAKRSGCAVEWSELDRVGRLLVQGLSEKDVVGCELQTVGVEIAGIRAEDGNDQVRLQQSKKQYEVPHRFAKQKTNERLTEWLMHPQRSNSL